MGSRTGWDYADFVAEITRLIEAADTSQDGDYGALVLERAKQKLGARTDRMESPVKIRDICLQMIYYRRAVQGHPGKFVIDRRMGTVPPANYEDPGPQSDAYSYPHNTKENVAEE